MENKLFQVPTLSTYSNQWLLKNGIDKFGIGVDQFEVTELFVMFMQPSGTSYRTVW